MAASHGVVVLVLLLVASPPAVLNAATDDGTTHLHFFMHDIVSGSDPTAVQVIQGPASFAAAPRLGLSFGDTNVFDDPLTETSSATAAPPVGRIQGTYMLSAQSAPVLMVTANIVLTSGEYNGSTIAVMGRDDTALDVRELAVIGGTGKFRMARGYVLWKIKDFKGPDATIELDVYVANASNNGTTIDASTTPVSTVDGASSSSSRSTRMSSAGKWVVAVAAVAVGSCWVW